MEIITKTYNISKNLGFKFKVSELDSEQLSLSLKNDTVTARWVDGNEYPVWDLNRENRKKLLKRTLGIFTKSSFLF